MLGEQLKGLSKQVLEQLCPRATDPFGDNRSKVGTLTVHHRIHIKVLSLLCDPRCFSSAHN